jgi:hypothetical protein
MRLYYRRNKMKLDKRDKIALTFVIIAGVILTPVALATIYNIEIDLPKKTDEWFNKKMNNTGKSPGKTIEGDVIDYYEFEYDMDLQFAIMGLIEEAFDKNDYKKLILIRDAIEEILHGKG